MQYSNLASGTIGWLSRSSYSDVLLTIVVIAVVGLMVLPLPMIVIDALVGVNISVAIVLLLSAIYIPAPTALPAFPSILLITTLFRLALSVAITRQILLNADGGEVVETFGQMVAGGNIVVGLVVFIIITVVQFLVIAKGAERVAEVAARFTLDAMPGKQLSIDSDLRSNLIDKDEARRRRRSLELESQLHGSLDGAMKFVKGDAIAGIVIILVNLIAGLSIGMMQLEMSLEEASVTYTILTIGDGLAAQIPALLSSIAAGLVVTRTSHDSRDAHLGAAVTRQLGSRPRVLGLTGAIALLFAMIPGFPTLVFLTISGILFFLAWRVMRNPIEESDLVAPRTLTGELELVEDIETEEIDLIHPLLIEHDGRAPLEQGSLNEVVQRVVERLRAEYGVPLPAPKLAESPRVGEGFALYIDGFKSSQQAWLSQQSSINEPNNTLPIVAAKGDLTVEDQLTYALRARMADFVGIQETSDMLEALGEQAPALVKETLRVVTPQQVTSILQRLVAEDIPIRSLRTTMDTLARVGGMENDIVVLTEHVRVALKAHIAERYADADGNLSALLVRPDLEDQLRSSVRATNTGSQLAVEPEFVERVLGSVQTLLEEHPSNHMVLLCTQDVRRHVRSLTESRFAWLPVLSYQELSNSLQINTVGQVAAS